MFDREKKRIYEIVELPRPGDLSSSLFSWFIMALIGFNVLAVILETERAVRVRYALHFEVFEILSIAVFTVEYLVRLWVCTEDEKYRGAVLGRLRHALTVFALIDLFAILPFYLPMLLPFDLRIIRGFRLFRLFRLFKFGRYSRSLRTLGRVLKAKKEELITAFFILGVFLVLSSGVLYAIEHRAQPEEFSSISKTMWWAVGTLTTVDLGEIAPVTAAGRVLGAAIALFVKIGMFAVPAGIMSAGYMEEVRRRRAGETGELPPVGDNG